MPKIHRDEFAKAWDQFNKHMGYKVVGPDEDALFPELWSVARFAAYLGNPISHKFMHLNLDNDPTEISVSNRVLNKLKLVQGDNAAFVCQVYRIKRRNPLRILRSIAVTTIFFACIMTMLFYAILYFTLGSILDW